MGEYRVQVKYHVGPADLAEITDLLDAAEAADGRRALGEHKWLDLVHGGRDGFAALLAHEIDDAVLVGYAQLTGERQAPGLELAIHPAHRGFAEHIGRALLQGAIGEVAGRGGGQITFWLHDPTKELEADAREAGFVPERRLLQLRVPLPLDVPSAPLPPGVELRPFVRGRDENAWLALNNRAFADHHEQGNWSVQKLEDREAEPWFDPEGLLMAWEADQLVGSCWTKEHRTVSPPMGEIFVIGVDPGHQGRGLGRTLTLAGLDWLAQIGLPVGMLYVDDANTAARNLYDSLGFTVHHVDRAYVRKLEPDGSTSAG